MNIIELLTPAYEAAWLPWAVQYFFLIGIATTAALLAAWLACAPAGTNSYPRSSFARVTKRAAKIPVRVTLGVRCR